MIVEELLQLSMTDPILDLPADFLPNYKIHQGPLIWLDIIGISSIISAISNKMRIQKYVLT